jgi:adenylate cyclase
MRLAMLLMAGLVLIVAAARARALLAREIDETRRRGNLTRYLPPQIADWLSEASVEEMRGGRRQPIAVLFADIRDFTRRAEALDPGELTRFVGGFRHCVTVAAGRHGGVIDKFVGDSAMVLFGVPEPGDHDARNALGCARAILDGVVAWNGRLAAAGLEPAEVGIGAHWGEVFCGAVGDDARLEFTVLGDAVNVAARLQEETKTAGRPLLVSRELLEAAGLSPDDEAWTALPEHQLRGRDTPVQMFAAR